MGLHKNITYVDGHIAHSLTFADAAARAAYSATSADVGRIAQQLDTLAFYILTDDSPLTWSAMGSSAATVKAVLLWGNNGVSSTTTTRYLMPCYEDALATTGAIQFRVPYAGTLKNLRVRHNTTAGNGNAIVYTLRVNSVASALTCSVNSTSADGSDVTNSVAVAAGDLLDIAVTKAASVGTSPSDIMASMELDAT